MSIFPSGRFIYLLMFVCIFWKKAKPKLWIQYHGIFADGRFIPCLGVQTWLRHCADRLKRSLHRSNNKHASSEEYDFQPLILHQTCQVLSTSWKSDHFLRLLSKALEGLLQPSAFEMKKCSFSYLPA